MPSFNPFSSVTGRNSYSLFDIRLDQDFIVFRGNDQESAGQCLKGVVVICLTSSLRIEDVRLRLTGTLRLAWTDSRISTPGVVSQRVDKTTTILDHRWPPFVGHHGKSITLPAGNYEYPFEFTLPGDTPESVEGIPEASITYCLKATVGRGKLAYDLHCYKHLRIIRTLEPGALEFLHAMSVENFWPNKIDYSIVIPQKAAVFGGTINMELRFTPLLKGLEVGEITAKMVETRDCWIEGPNGVSIRERRTEREVASWTFEIDHEEHWHDMIDDTGQEGWTMTKPLKLPTRLCQCIQDLNHHGIKVRHKIKLTVALKNPDGHISELRASLPISIFISPNLPFDEQGNVLNETSAGETTEHCFGLIAPPGYGDHVLDQLYEHVDPAGFRTPGFGSGVSSPYFPHSRTGSSENLAAIARSAPVTPAALSSRLENMTLSSSQRNSSYTSMYSGSSIASPGWLVMGAAGRWESQSASLTRRNSEEERSGRNSTEFADGDLIEFKELNRVPSYATAVRTPARSRTQTGSGLVPDYQTALSAPRTPPATETTAEMMVSSTATTEESVGENHGRSRIPANLTMTQAYPDEQHPRPNPSQGGAPP